MLERLSSAPETRSQSLANSEPMAALWVFVSTIGELNAIAPFLRQLIEQHPQLQLILLTDRNIYRAAYLAQYPTAQVIEIGASSKQARELSQQYPPELFIIAEIPCLPSDAPCRLPFAYLLQAKRAGAVIALINGWIYGYEASCRIDLVERTLLGRSYLQLIDVLCVQTAAVAKILTQAGANPVNVHITGNIKFDALAGVVRPWGATRSPHILQSIELSGRPVLVAGCVTESSELELVLDAFVSLLGHNPQSLLILAPRHPENNDAMQSLFSAAQSRKLNYRSRHVDGDQAVPDSIQLLILDTMGELHDFYGRAQIAHVGRDHNVLEPISLGKPVTVRPNWNDSYPSFPVFSLTQAAALLNVADDAATLCTHWLASIERGPASSQNISKTISHLTGASILCQQFVAQAISGSRAR
ncbi:3-deoxy-D-manno-octulosonic acid transferase [Paucibacter sp. B2R-40]|uniref:3-deoxy-D-manno-octulosonic acid transferase n=1 Tax=Paucibacter sp. B2R-40 TaxID=2893554 RepID=UPI0021E3A1F5|nr:glycosyltransferase N-terminal domain-containing protein [Paucibacter sp. B2R-40]